MNDQNKTTRFSNKGYSILKQSIDEKKLKEIRKELTIQPFEKVIFMLRKMNRALPEKFTVFAESKSRIYLPKFFGLKNFKKPHENKTNPEQIHAEFKGDLRENQKEIIKSFLPKFYSDTGGILNVKTGGGKTCMACYIISKLKVKTLILVHKQFLADQWISRINQFLPNVKISKIQGKTVDSSGDIVLGMIQSISSKNFDADFFKNFGLTVVDECHHIASKIFSTVFLKCSSNYHLGLSATTQRKDGASFVLNYFLGETFEYGNDSKGFGTVHIYKREFSDPIHQKNIINYNGTKNFSGMLTNLAKSQKRVKFIIDEIKNLREKDPTRHFLILSERKSLIENLSIQLEDEGLEYGFAIGGVKQNDLVKNCLKQIVLATYSYVSEGFDVPTLDTLILATPKSDIVQSVGRILRLEEKDRKNVPVIVDIADKGFERQYSVRKKYYKQNSFVIS